MSTQPQLEPKPSNGLGIAGFVISIVGFCTGGVLSPIGMIISFVAMFKQPKGLAIAGFVIGLLGSVWIFIAVVFIGLGTLLAAFGMQGFVQFGTDSLAINVAVQEAHAESGVAPTDLSSLGLDETVLIDGWGNRYRYEVREDGSGFSITSNGPDGSPDTADDLTAEFPFGN